MPQSTPVVSIVIVSFNTRELLCECLNSAQHEAQSLDHEVIVVDNASRDGSAEMVAAKFPAVRLIRSDVNLGFAAANNRAFAVAQGRYVVLLNSDAFMRPGALDLAVALMEAHPHVGLGGARLVGRDGGGQPSARMFPSLLNDLLTLSGLAARFPQSPFFGRVDRTWADPREACAVDWTPGAFAILRRAVLDEIGAFDEDFFLYYEEVDLCRRIKQAGYAIWYWPQIEVIHYGGESSKTLKRLTLSATGSQLTLWRMRSALLYYRKHHGALSAWAAMQLETLWHRLRVWRNARRAQADAEAKAQESLTIIQLMQQAWRETAGGRRSPARPW